MVCRRDEYDTTVAIRSLIRHIADQELKKGAPALPKPAPGNGKKIGIVGAGPTGLASAYCLLLKGYACTLFDDRKEPWGEVRDQHAEESVPGEVFAAEVEKIHRLGAVFHMETRIGRDMTLAELMRDFDAVVLAIGKVAPETPAQYGLERGERGIAVNSKTFQTSIEKVFCGGDAVRPFVLVAQSVADGRGIAQSVDEYLSNKPLTGQTRRFNSRIGRLKGDELERLVEGYDRRAQVVPEAGEQKGFSQAEAIEEAGRCLHCECLKPETCKLRLYADEYGAQQDRYLQRDRNSYSRILQHADVIFEPGKCIKCGLCVRITEQSGEPLGLTFVERGFGVSVSAPFDETMTEALGDVANETVQACPTAALSLKSHQLRKMPNA